MAAPFRFSKIVIVESLEPHETRTGHALFEFLQGHELMQSLRMPVEYKTCGTFRDFIDYLGQLEVEVRQTGHAPLLHVECHGDELHGLEFANGSTLAWSELSAALVPLNRATGFNFVAVFSACYGGHFLGRLLSIDPAPCYAMVAPTETIEPSEILAAFRIFYSVLFTRKDVGLAISALALHSLSKGWWFGQHAELWFEKVTIGYVQNHCTKKAIRARSRTMYRQLIDKGARQSFGHLKRQIRKANRENLLQEHFDRYFMIESLPGNRLRFKAVHKRLQKELGRLRSTGRYLV